MRDIMKGYNKRNKRRRSSSRRKRTSKFYNMSNRDKYITRSSYSPGSRRKALAGWGGKLALALVCLAVIAAAVFLIVQANRRSTDKNPLKVVSGSVVSAEAVMAQGNVDGTGVLPAENGVVTPAPATEETVSPAAENTAAPTDAPVNDVAASSGAVGDDTKNDTVPGGISEAVAAVNNISPDDIATPAPTPKSKAVAITFDDGPSTVNTPKILEILKKYNAKATFFVVGNRVEKGADLIRQEVEMGCEIANHSWDHSNLSKMSMKKVNKQYDKTAKLVKKIAGYDTSLLRPPYGAISDKMRKKLKHPMILWSIDTLDWKYHNGKKEFKVVKKNISDGDIILMHDIHAETADGLEKILPWLIEQDYDILTVSELMERKGIKLKNGKVYASGK